MSRFSKLMALLPMDRVLTDPIVRLYVLFNGTTMGCRRNRSCLCLHTLHHSSFLAYMNRLPIWMSWKEHGFVQCVAMAYRAVLAASVVKVEWFVVIIAISGITWGVPHCLPRTLHIFKHVQLPLYVSLVDRRYLESLITNQLSMFWHWLG